MEKIIDDFRNRRADILLGTQMDFRTEKLSATFVFNNPNQTSACGCGESVAITPANASGATV